MYNSQCDKTSNVTKKIHESKSISKNVSLTRWRTTLIASLDLEGERSNWLSACPISATLLDNFTSLPIKTHPAQFAGCENCRVFCTVFIASQSALLDFVP